MPLAAELAASAAFGRHLWLPARAVGRFDPPVGPHPMVRKACCLAAHPLRDSDDHLPADERVQGEDAFGARIDDALAPTVNGASRDTEKDYSSLNRARLC